MSLKALSGGVTHEEKSLTLGASSISQSKEGKFCGLTTLYGLRSNGAVG